MKKKSKNILSIFKNIKMEIEAPSYFAENNKILQAIEKKVADKLKVDVSWLRQQQTRKPEEFNEAIHWFAEQYGWDEHDRRSVVFLLNSTEIFVKYAWVRFMVEHIDDEWGRSDPDALTYDDKRNKIIMKWLQPRKIASKIIKPIKSIFIPQGGKFKRKIIK